MKQGTPFVLHRGAFAAWGLGVLLAVVFVYVAVPSLVVTDTGDMDRADVLDAENDVRATLLTGLAGVGLLVTVFLTWRQVVVTREGQLTDRYAKAIELLGRRSEVEGSIDVRVGGIFALMRVARDSAGDALSVKAALSIFVREHSPATAADDVAAPDIRAAVMVIGMFPTPGLISDLSNSNLRGAWIPAKTYAKADFQGSNLDQTNLAGTDLTRADLRGASLIGADLRQADFADADVTRADLTGADLRGAKLRAARGLAEATLGDPVMLDQHTTWPDDVERPRRVEPIEEEPRRGTSPTQVFDAYRKTRKLPMRLSPDDDKESGPSPPF